MKEDCLMPFQNWRQNQFDLKKSFVDKKQHFIAQLIPEIAVKLNIYEVLTVLNQRLGNQVLMAALNPINTIKSPVESHQNADWLKSVNMVGVNIRTIGNFFNLIKYLLTLSESQNSIHILPIWEPGVVSSLYGKISWNLNPEFYSHELANAIPDLNSTEKQLKVVTNIVHSMGKTIGLDVIPHTDRFSEITFAYPQYFEWVHRKEAQILSINHANAIKVEEIIWNYLHVKGSANGAMLSFSKDDFFNSDFRKFDEAYKLEILFGAEWDAEKRLNRRLELMQEMLYNGYETLPVTMAPPYRGLHLVENDFVYDQRGNKWYNYHFDHPELMSRVFGPLTRYKFFETENDSSQELDFEKPNVFAWQYIAQKYYDCQKKYNFDFMRGDMAHVQPRAEGVPKGYLDYYDPLLGIKQFIIEQGVPYFGFFAETFIAPPNIMGYGKEEEHLAKIKAEATLGDLQGSVIDSDDFREKLFTYLNLIDNTSFAPNFTMITADKDDPRFDGFYKEGNHLRFFVGLFLKTMPSYMSLGFECRNLHENRGKNEEYTKLYVFQICDESDTDKVTKGPFIWGVNYRQFELFEKIKILADEILNSTSEFPLIWISRKSKLLSWSIGNYIFEANLDSKDALPELNKMRLLFSTLDYSKTHECRILQKH